MWFSPLDCLILGLLWLWWARQSNLNTIFILHKTKSKSRERERVSWRERMGREVSESCVDSLITEMVSSYCDRFYANKPDLAVHRIEAIGFQVGLQLSERYTSPHLIPTLFSIYLLISVNCVNFSNWGFRSERVF